jgi:hypothetical protein
VPEALPVLEEAELAGSMTIEGQEIQIRLSGIGDMRSTVELGRFLTSTHQIAVARGCQQVEADLEYLEFLSSAGLKALVNWALSASEQGYRIRLRSSPRHPWQASSLRVIGGIAPDTIEIVTGEASQVSPPPRRR